MANDLEDSILKQNVPGRWSTHDGNRKDDLRQEDLDENFEVEDDIIPQTEEEALFDHARYLANADVPEPIRRGILNDRMGKSKTGVKGVLADYEAACELSKAQREATAEFRKAVLTTIAEGSKMTAEDYKKMLLRNDLQKAQRDSDDSEIDAGDESDEEEEEFLEVIRKNWLRQKMGSCNKPQFGNVKEVGSEDLIEEIDCMDPRVVVIVHLYEPSISSCTRMNRYLEEIARKMTGIKFLRMHASRNGIELDRMTLPILNIYHGGKHVVALAGIAEELGEHFVREDVEWLVDSTLEANKLL
jgi:Phosducin